MLLTHISILLVTEQFLSLLHKVLFYVIFCNNLKFIALTLTDKAQVREYALSLQYVPSLRTCKEELNGRLQQSLRYRFKPVFDNHKKLKMFFKKELKHKNSRTNKSSTKLFWFVYFCQ